MTIEITMHLYEIREKRKMSLRRLVDISEISKTHINDIENGAKYPTLFTLCALASALEVEPSELFTYKIIKSPL